MSLFPFGKGPKASRPPGPRAERFPLAEVVDALRHLLALVDRAANAPGLPATLERGMRRASARLQTVSGPADLEAMSLDLLELRLPVELRPEGDAILGRARALCLEASLYVAEALGTDGLDLGLRRLIDRQDEPRAQEHFVQNYPKEMERLAAAVRFLRGTADVLKHSVGELVEAIRPLAKHEPAVERRLLRIRKRLEGTAEIRELEELRAVLVAETTALVEGARSRTTVVEQVIERVRYTQTHVALLEHALHDARAMARTDPLTGLGNRRAMDECVALHGKSGVEVALLALDLDHFKRVNDGLGHAAGDTVLRWVGDTLRAELRGDDVGFRVGGEELVVLLPGTRLDGAMRTAERLRMRIARAPISTEAGTVEITVSIGVATWGAGESFESSLKRADAALYEAKKMGRDRVLSAPARGAGAR
ncbi:MAG: GGDEF domain-containing protein [Myxococcales bacterium]|nr:GGDEF domain-containing protein [Myxococcales bacterium]